MKMKSIQSKKNVVDIDKMLMPPPPPRIMKKRAREDDVKRFEVAFVLPPKQLLEVVMRVQNRNYYQAISLHQAYGLLKQTKLFNGRLASLEELARFHGNDYIELLSNLDEDTETDLLDEYGLIDDCPVVNDLLKYCQAVAGSSLVSAEILCAKEANAVISWTGGRHHAKKSEASGFCYINDIVLAILKLRETFHKILYIDLDIHHGDGVEEAFMFSEDVFTLSLHKFQAGFFPNTGGIKSIGKGKGKYRSMNIPLKGGIGGPDYKRVFNEVFSLCVSEFQPDAIGSRVYLLYLYGIQDKQDMLIPSIILNTLRSYTYSTVWYNSDPIGDFNLKIKDIGECIKRIKSHSTPTLYLGGGGYDINILSRAWTYFTAIIASTDNNSNNNNNNNSNNEPYLPNDIPDHEYISQYIPSFTLHASDNKTPAASSHSSRSCVMSDDTLDVVMKGNDSGYIDAILSKTRRNMGKLRKLLHGKNKME